MGLKMRFSIILLFAILSLMPGTANAATVSDLSKQFICQCGCNMVLLNCSHAECGSREAMTTVIQQKISQGQSEAQITQFFVSQYGEQVLSSPTKQGFNLTAWITPFLALLVGAVAIYLALKKWVRREAVSQAHPPAEERDEVYLRQLEDELKVFSDRSFR